MKKEIIAVLCIGLIVLSGCSGNVNNESSEAVKEPQVFVSASKEETTDVDSLTDEIIKDDDVDVNNNESYDKPKETIEASTPGPIAEPKQETVVEHVEQNSSPSTSVENTKNNQSEVIPETPKPEPTNTPTSVCPNGKDPSLACDAIMDSNYYFASFPSEQEADSQGQYYLNEVIYLGDLEITSYSIQPVYRNDHSIAYYGLNLWSNGQLIQ